jgi:hypothetical protein
MDRLQTPPIRTPLGEGEPQPAGRNAATSKTAKEWYYYWRQTGDQTNLNTDGLAAAVAKLDGLVTFGDHADRPATAPEGALYLEADRGSVLYQLQDGEWVYVSGVMWGALSPDERPADLGSPNDIGFEFWAVDQAPVRKYIWNGSAWIEQTPVIYGTHAARLALTVSDVALGVLFIETDRSNVVYEMRRPASSNVWVYVTGTMTGTMSPDQRPGDLGTNDTGFLFLSTDSSQTFRWSGSAWVDLTAVAPANDFQNGVGSGSMTLTTTATAIPGLSLTITRAGVYAITAITDFALTGAGDAGSILLSQIAVDGAVIGRFGIFQTDTASATSNRACIPILARYVSGGGSHTLTVLAHKNAGTGTSVVFPGNSTLSSMWISP